MLNVPDFLPYAFFSVIYFGNEIRNKRVNKYFVTKLFITPQETEIIYKFKSEEERTLKGANSDFDFKLKNHASESRNALTYISISYQGKEVIRQFEIDNWAKQDIEQIVMDICIIKGDEFWISPFRRAVQNSGRKFIRLVFPKFNFD